jgi:hypothetical protein
VARIISNPGSDTLTREDAVQLAGLPMGLADCTVDQGDNLVFNMNQLGSAQVVARWDGTTGNGYNFDTLSVATGEYDWLWFIRSQGDFTLQEMNNRLITFSFGQPLAELHTVDYPPFVKNPVPDLTMMVEQSDTTIDISQVFTDPDDPDSLIIIAVVYNSDTAVVNAKIEGDSLRIHHEPLIALKSEYRPVELVLEGRSLNLSVTDTLLVNAEFISGVESGMTNQIQVYPNPSRGRFLVSTTGLQPLIVKVYDLTGKEIYSESEFRPGSVIDLSSKTTGVYILKLIRGSRNITHLIYKQ